MIFLSLTSRIRSASPIAVCATVMGVLGGCAWLLLAWIDGGGNLLLSDDGWLGLVGTALLAPFALMLLVVRGQSGGYPALVAAALGRFAGVFGATVTTGKVMSQGLGVLKLVVAVLLLVLVLWACVKLSARATMAAAAQRPASLAQTILGTVLLALVGGIAGFCLAGSELRGTVSNIVELTLAVAELILWLTLPAAVFAGGRVWGAVSVLGAWFLGVHAVVERWDDIELLGVGLFGALVLSAVALIAWVAASRGLPGRLTAASPQVRAVAQIVIWAVPVCLMLALIAIANVG